MKKILLFVLTFILFTFKANAIELDISSENAILYNLDSGEVLYEKNADEVRAIASLTKIMTALVALENIDDLDAQVVLTSEDFEGLIEANAVTAGFTKGEVVTYRDLLYGLLLPSGADAAKALARNIAGSEDNFIQKMNDKVKEMKLEHTHFSTVIGLDDEENYSTAREVSLIFKEALKNQDFKTIITTNDYVTSDGQIKFNSTIQGNATKFEIDIPYVLGGKTGTTTDAGLCLATIAEANDVNYMLVTLGALYDKKAPHNIEDAKTIYDYFIQNYSNQVIVNKKEPFQEIKAKYTEEESVKLYPTDTIMMYLENNYDKNDIKFIYNGKEEISSFTKKGETLGTLYIYYQDELIETQTITLNENLKFSLLGFIKENFLLILLFSIILIIILIIFIKKRKKYKIAS